MERHNTRNTETQIYANQEQAIYKIVERLNEKRKNELYKLLIRYRRLNGEHRTRYGKGSPLFTAKIRVIRKELEGKFFMTDLD
jgi:hypothetical protein